MTGSLPNDEREGKVHEAAVAAMVLGGVTVHQFLLAQGHKLPRVDSICTLHRSRCRERPARTALQEQINLSQAAELVREDRGYKEHKPSKQRSWRTS